MSIFSLPTDKEAGSLFRSPTDIARSVPTQPELGFGQEGELVKGLRRGLSSSVGMVQGAGGQLLEPFAPEAAQGLFGDAAATVASGQQMAPAAVDSYKKVHSLSDAYDYALGAIGEGLPTMAVALGGGLAGRGAALAAGARGGFMPTIAGGAAGVFPMEMGEQALTMQDDPQALANTTAGKRLALASGKGVVNSLLEAAPEALGINTLLKPVTGGLKGALGSIGRSAAIGGLAEGPLTEAPQEMVGQYFHTLANPTRDTSHDWEDVKEAAIKGALPGATLGSMHGAGRAALSTPVALGEAAVDATKAGFEKAAPYAEAAGEALKAGATKTAETLDEGIKKTAAFVDMLDKEMQKDGGVDLASDAILKAEDKVHNVKGALGETYDEVKDWMQPLVDHYNNTDWSSETAKTLRNAIQAGKTDGARGIYNALGDAGAQELAAVKKTLGEMKAKVKDQPVVKAMDEVKATKEKDDLSDISFSKKGTKGDPVNKAVKIGLAGLSLSDEFVNQISSRLDLNRVTKNGRSNVTQTATNAVVEAIQAMDEGHQAILNNPKLRNRVITTIVDRIRPEVEKVLTEHTPNLPEGGSILAYKNFVQRRHADDKLTGEQVDMLADHYRDMSRELAQGADSRKFVSYMRDKFGDQTDDVLSELVDIAKMEGVNTDSLRSDSQRIGRLTLKMSEHMGRKITTEDMGKMLGDMKDYEDAFGSLRDPKLRKTADERMMNYWGIKDAKTFESVLNTLRAYEGDKARVTQSNISDLEISESGKGVRMAQRAKDPHRLAGKTTLSDEDVDATDITDDQDADVMHLPSRSLDPNSQQEVQQKRDEENGIQAVTNKAEYHGVGILTNKSHRHNYNEVQAPLSLHHSADYERGTITPGGQFSQALEKAHSIYGHRVAQGRPVKMWQWAREMSQFNKGKSERQYLNEAMEALLAHDQERKKDLLRIAKEKGVDVTKDLDYIEARASLARRIKAEHDDDSVGARFFHPEEKLTSSYRYYKMEQEDAANLRFTTEQLATHYGVRDGENVNEMINRIRGREGKENVQNRNDVIDSLIALEIEGQEDPLLIDFAGLVKDVLRKHQQADVEGVKDSTRKHESFRPGESVANDADHMLDPLGNEQDIERILRGEGNANRGLMNAVNTVLATLWLTPGVVGVARKGATVDLPNGMKSKAYHHGYLKGSKGKDAKMGGGLDPNLVVFRDFNTGRVIRAGDLSNFTKVDDEGNVVSKKGPIGFLGENDIATIAPATSTRIERTAVNNPDKVNTLTRVAAEHGVMTGALKAKDGTRHDLNVRELINHMMIRYGLEDIVDTRSNDMISNELLATMLSMGIKELTDLTDMKFEPDYTIKGANSGDVQVNNNIDNVVVGEGFKPSENPGGEPGRYDISYGRIKQLMVQLSTGKELVGDKDFESHKNAIVKKDIADLEEIIRKNAEKKSKDAAQPRATSELLERDIAVDNEERMAALYRRIQNEFGFDPTDKAPGDVDDNLLDITSGLTGRLPDSLGNSYLERRRTLRSTDAEDKRAITGEGSHGIRVAEANEKLGVKPVNIPDTPKASSTHGEDRSGGPTISEDEPLKGSTEILAAVQGKRGERTPMPETPAQLKARRAAVKKAADKVAKVKARAERMAFAKNLRTPVEGATVEEVKDNSAEERMRRLAELNGEATPTGARDEEVPFSKSTKKTDYFSSLEAAIEAEKQQLIGDLVGMRLEDSDTVTAPNGESGSAYFNPATNEMVLAMLADPLNNVRHEVWHKVSKMLSELGPKGQEILKTVYSHVTTPMMVKWLERMANGDEGMLAQIAEGKPDELAAMAFQLYREGHRMPLHSETKTRFQKIVDFFKRVVNKMGIKGTTAKQRSENFFQFIGDGGFLREHSNPEALIAALGKTKTDKFGEMVAKAYEPIDDALSVVFGNTVNRLRKFGIPEYQQIIELYAGKGGKGGMNAAVEQGTNEWGNRAARMLDGLNEAERATFARTQAYRNFTGYTDEKGVRHAGFDDFLIQRMMDGGATDEEALNALAKVYNNLAAYDRNKVYERFEEFVIDLQKHGGVDGPGKAREIAQIIVDDGFYDGDVELFADNDAIRRKWESTDAKDYMARLVFTGVRRAERMHWMGVNDGKLKAIREAGDKKAAGEARQLADKVFQAYNGTLAQGKLSNGTRELMGALLTANNIRLLPFALFSQMMEPLQLALRRNDFGAAFDALWRGMKDLPRTFAGIDKKLYTPDYWEKLSKEIGTTADEIMGDVLGQMYNGIKINGKVGWINDKFFRYNFMQQWNRSMHIAATKHGVQFLIEQATTPNSKHGERWLQELGVTAGMIKQKHIIAHDENGREIHSLDLTSDDVVSRELKRAVYQYVEEAIAHPDAGSNSLWMNDPRFALLAHMKRFTFAFSQYVLGRGINEIKNGNMFPLLPTLAAVPWMVTSDALRDIVKPGEETYKNNWGFTDYTLNGIERSSLLGKWTFPDDMVKTQRMGGSAIEAAMGPTAEMFGNVARWTTQLGK